MNDIVGTTIRTSGGRIVDPFSVKASDGVFDIDDIAHALSQLCRYGGHTSRFYSVAEHCVLVERVVAVHFHNVPSPSRVLEARRWALMHDAEEAYLMDMPAPFKAMADMRAYREAGKRLSREIATWLGLGAEPEYVDRVDKTIRGNERRDLFPRTEPFGGSYYEGIVCGTMTPEQAKAAFLAKFHELWPEWNESRVEPCGWIT